MYQHMYFITTLQLCILSRIFTMSSFSTVILSPIFTLSFFPTVIKVFVFAVLANTFQQGANYRSHQRLPPNAIYRDLRCYTSNNYWKLGNGRGSFNMAVYALQQFCRISVFYFSMIHLRTIFDWVHANASSRSIVKISTFKI